VIGELNQRAALQAHVLTPDGGGGFSESWQTFASVWVAVAPIGGNDALSADALQSRVRHRILLRRRGDLAAGQRVVVGARRFKVQGMLDEGPQAATVTLLCEELP